MQKESGSRAVYVYALRNFKFFLKKKRNINVARSAVQLQVKWSVWPRQKSEINRTLI
jgi:hypothetical protein